MSGETVTGERVQHHAPTDGINLMDGESVLENRRPSGTLWWKHITVALLVLLFGLGGDAAAGGILLAGLIAAYVVLARTRSRYIVTDERVKGKVGLLSKKEMEYRIADLRSIVSKQTFIERILGRGTVELEAGANNKLIWHGVPEYEDVTNTIREQQRRYD